MEIAVNSVADGAISYGPGKLPGVKKMTKGRWNWNSVYRGVLTRLRNGTASRMSLKVIGKGIVSSIWGGVYLDAYYGIKQFSYEKVKAKCMRL